MKGNHAFCPKTGASLSNTTHYDERGRGFHTPVPDRFAEEPDTGDLTLGARCSSTTALLTHFRRCHDREKDATPGGDLQSRAALALRRLKRASDGVNAWDMVVWLTLVERLDRCGHEVGWMRGHVELRCPDCYGHLQYRTLAGGTPIARCGTHCTEAPRDRLHQIRTLVADLYRRTFDPDTDLSADDVAHP
ncbi:hypothetical protein [Haloarchaeobius amylolyticus]|uniref:hypothetical protein n=1 Tax=Haloarchaeobius amylolyticus TaxID=1198296 RepID=UPI00226E8BA1|nr:hypothetical protein [Haloarchaeobius amylolyticus]